MAFPNLLSPIKLGSLQLPNRVIMAPLTRGRAGPEMTANEIMAKYYTQRASAGLIITEGVHVSIFGRGFIYAPDMFESRHAEGWRIVTDSVHAAGGRIFCQLYHSGRAGHSSFRDEEKGLTNAEKLSVAPSAIKRPSRSGKQSYANAPGQVDVETPRALLTHEVKEIVEQFRNSAQLARDAGFDGVELHGANGYLLDEFLQSCSNKRTDEYGGSLENRFRLVDEALRAVMEVFEPWQVAIRLSPNGTYNGMGSDDYRESFLYYAKRLADLKIGYLHILDGLAFGFHKLGDPLTLADFKKVFPGLIVGNCGYTAETAEEAIASGDADMISFGRPFLSNPDLVERFAAGAELNEAASHDVWYSSFEVEWGEKGYTDFKTMGKVKT